MPKRGKNYKEAVQAYDKAELYDVDPAMEIVTKTAKAKFDETVEVHVRLGVDGRHADQQVRGAIVLPHGTGKTKKVLVFAKGPKAAEAEEAGADFVGAEEMAQKIQSENWFDFDVIIATPDMMGVVGRLGKILGPKGLMPNPKSGTVTMDVTKAIADVKAGKVEYRLDKTNIIHTPIGKASFGAEKLTDNFNDWWPLHYYLGVAYEMTGRRSEAVSAFRKVLQLNGSHLETMKELMSIYEDEGDRENTRKYREKIKLIEAAMEEEHQQHLEEIQEEDKKLEEEEPELMEPEHIDTGDADKMADAVPADAKGDAEETSEDLADADEEEVAEPKEKRKGLVKRFGKK